MKTLKNIGATLLRLLSVLWQLPQTVIGLLLLLFYSPAQLLEVRGDVYFLKSDMMPGAISLGNIVILSSWANGDTINHEWGHCKQSRVLGWFYLFVIGIPSIVWAGLHTYSKKYQKRSYYSFYTERWADKWGGVTRK